MVSRSRLVHVASVGAIFLSLGFLGAAAHADSISIANPSFQNGSANYPGYTAISGWTENNTNSGVNGPGQPFANGTNFPDANQVGFLQNNGTSGSAPTSISQNISGLTPGEQYWFQVFYNGRESGGSTAAPSPGLVATYGNQPIASVSNISTTNPNYTLLNAAFIPTSSSGTLTIENSAPSAVSGDNTLLIDAVSVIQRNPGQIVIANPSFEGSTNETWVYPGYITNIGGWNTTGQTGVNTANGPFADNGTIPDGSQVGFLQNNNASTAAASLSQTLTGLTAGTTYQLKFYYNARLGAGTSDEGNPILDVSLGGTPLAGSGQTVLPVGSSPGAAAPYDVFTADYTATGSSALLDVSNGALFGGAGTPDSTLLVDNFSLAPVTAIPEPASLALVVVGATAFLMRKRRRVA